MSHSSHSAALKPTLPFTSYQKFVIAVLVFLQFTVILDFMIMAPLGAIVMEAFKITPKQFGLVVSAYAFSAGASGLLAAGFADRFDRKKMLLFFYIGFVLGTLFCAVAPTYELLLLARTVTGLFGGVIGSIVMAIATDLFTLDQRGRVVGFIQTAFGASQILGIPFGLFLSNHFEWHASFYMIVICSVLVGFVIFAKLKPVDGHLKLQNKNENGLAHVKKAFSERIHLVGFAATAMVSLGGFLLMPFTSAFTVQNLKITLDQLPWIYLVTGVFGLLMGPIIGKFCDQYGKLKVFGVGAIITNIMVVIYTNLGPTPLFWVILVNIIFFVGIFSRIIPSQALISSLPAPANRGAFMAINSSLQQVSGGVASVISGLIVVQAVSGELEHFDTLGYILFVIVVISWFMMVKINKVVLSRSSQVNK